MNPPAVAFIVLVELFNCDAIHRSLNVPNGIPVISSCNMCDVVSVPMNETFYVVEGKYSAKARNALVIGLYGCMSNVSREAIVKAPSSTSWISNYYIDSICPLDIQRWTEFLPAMTQAAHRPGIRVGAGTGIDQILMCLHYHGAPEELAHMLTERTKMTIELVPVSEHPEIRSADMLNLGYAHSVHVNSGSSIKYHLFQERAIITMFTRQAHAHTRETYPLWIEYWFKNLTAMTLLANITQDSVIKHSAALLVDKLAVNNGDKLILKCHFQHNGPFTDEDVEKHTVPFCFAPILYFLDDGTQLQETAVIDHIPDVMQAVRRCDVDSAQIWK